MTLLNKYKINLINNNLKQFGDFAAGPIIGAIVSILTVSITTRLVVPEEFGKTAIFTLVQTLFTLVAFLGLDQAFVRYYNEQEDKKKLLFNSLIPVSILCLGSIICIIIFRYDLSLILFGQYEPIIMWLFIPFLPSLVIHQFGMLNIRMELRGKLYSLLNIIIQSLVLLFTLLLLFFFEKSFRSIVFATIFSNCFTAIITIFFTQKIWSIDISNFDKTLISRMIKFGLPWVPAMILSWILNSIDKIELRELSTYNELGLYAAAFKIVALLSVLKSSFTSAWIPIAYRWHSTNESHDKFEKASVITLVVMSFIFSLMVVFRDIIVFFLGPAYRNTDIIFLYLLFVPVMYTVSETTALGIAFSEKTVFNIFVTLICAVLNIFGNYLLIPILGAKGAAISTSITYIVFFIARTLFSRYLWFKFKLSKYFLVIIFMIFLVLIADFNLPKYMEVLGMFSLFVVDLILLYRYKIIQKVIA
jgi:O-antigen/teichoic acid export membrane protein